MSEGGGAGGVGDRTHDRTRDRAGEMLPGLRAAVDDSRSRAAATRRRRAAEAEPAAVDPVARVLVDVSLAHLDRPFDYRVSAAQAEAAVPGARVKVRFAGQDVHGFILERAADSDHAGTLQPLRRVVSPEPVLSPPVAALAEAIAERYAGTRADVLRLAIPPRHARTEQAERAAVPPLTPPARPGGAAWAGHQHAPAFLRHLADGGRPRAVWTVAPATDWPAALADAAAATLASGRGVAICVPDRRDLARVDAALSATLGEGRHVALSAEAGPATRYRQFLSVSRGDVHVVVGTRAAAFAPVHDLGLVVIWDDGDDLHAEPRAPYPHAREVLLTRAEQSGSAALVASPARSVEAHQLVTTGWAHEIVATREELRARVRVAVAGGEADLARDAAARSARVPHGVHETIRSAVARGPVLVQTPRAGYLTALACERCRTSARCGACAGPLRLGGPTQPPTCAWCGRADPAWACPACGARGLRAPVLGDARTAEELGRSFPGVAVTQSSGDHVVAQVPDRPAIVVATPGAEPVAAAGYAAVVLLDTWLLLARDDLRADEEALRRWLGAASLVGRGGEVVAVGDPAHPALQALVRWDPVGAAEREAGERRAARLPPATRIATLTGEAGAVDDALTLLAPPESVEVLGPVPHGEDEWRAVVRTPRARGAALSRALGEMQRLRSARKLDAVRVQVDPPTL